MLTFEFIILVKISLDSTLSSTSNEISLLTCGKFVNFCIVFMPTFNFEILSSSTIQPITTFFIPKSFKSSG